MSGVSLILEKSKPIPEGISSKRSIGMEKAIAITSTIAAACFWGASGLAVAAPLIYPISIALDSLYSAKTAPVIKNNELIREKNNHLIEQKKNHLLENTSRIIKTSLGSGVSLLGAYVIHSISNSFCFKSEGSTECLISNKLFYLASAISIITSAMFAKAFLKRG